MSDKRFVCDEDLTIILKCFVQLVHENVLIKKKKAKLVNDVKKVQ